MLHLLENECTTLDNGEYPDTGFKLSKLYWKYRNMHIIIMQNIRKELLNIIILNNNNNNIFIINFI